MIDFSAALGMMFDPSNFTDHWRMAMGIIALFSLVLSTAGLFLVVIQLYALYRQADRSQRAETSRLFIEVMDRWSLQYENRNRLISAAPKTLADIKSIYPDATALLNSTHWREEIRPLLNFYEFLGVLIDNQNIDRESIFVLVTVDTFDCWASTGTGLRGKTRKVTLDDCTIYQRLKPYINFLRQETGYRGDIYEFYDRHLLREYLDHANHKRSRL